MRNAYVYSYALFSVSASWLFLDHSLPEFTEIIENKTQIHELLANKSYLTTFASSDRNHSVNTAGG